jgi:hypothetical protein
MSTAPSIGIPELAGICTYETAAEVGFSVEESVRRLVRLHWTHKRLLEACVSHLPAAPEWEIKSALALHLWQDAEHAEAIRGRTTEMRSPPPRLDVAPDDALDAWLEEQLRAEGSLELVVGLYGVARPALIDAYRRYLDGSNPLVDHPTRRLLRFHLFEEIEALGGKAVANTETSRSPASRASFPHEVVIPTTHSMPASVSHIEAWRFVRIAFRRDGCLHAARSTKAATVRAVPDFPRQPGPSII